LAACVERFDSDEVLWAQRGHLEAEILRFGTIIPELSSVYQEHLTSKDIELISIKTLMYTSTIHLHREYFTINWESYERCITAADAIALMTQELSGNDYAFLNPLVSVRYLGCS
jgi:hypothetical protein